MFGNVDAAVSSPQTISDLAVLKSWTNWEIRPKSSLESWSAGSPNFSWNKVTQRFLRNLDQELFVRLQKTSLNMKYFRKYSFFNKKKKKWPCIVTANVTRRTSHTNRWRHMTWSSSGHITLSLFGHVTGPTSTSDERELVPAHHHCWFSSSSSWCGTSVEDFLWCLLHVSDFEESKTETRQCRHCVAIRHWGQRSTVLDSRRRRASVWTGRRPAVTSLMGNTPAPKRREESAS